MSDRHRGENDETKHGKQEAEGDEGEAQTCEVGGEGEEEEHYGAGDVGGDGVEVCFHG